MKPLTFRQFCESRRYLGMSLSPLIAAVMDAAEGRPVDTIDDDACRQHLGCGLDALPKHRSRIVAIRAGLRARKTSGMGVPAMLFATWHVPAPHLAPGEVASVPIICPDLDLARQALSFAVGLVDTSPILKRAKIHEDGDSVTLKRALDGREVRIEVRAAARGGRTGRGRTLLGALLDEVCQFRDPDSGVVNDLEIHRAVSPRIVAGGWEWIISTPWIAHQGLLESYVDKNLGNHEHALVAIGGTRAFNPGWDPTGEIERDERERDPENAAREIDAIPMSGGSNGFFDNDAITTAAGYDRPLELPPRYDAAYSFGADFAFRRDSSALVGVEQLGKSLTVAFLDEQRPARGAPLKPSVVVAGFATQMKRYNARSVCADGHYRESIDEHLAANGLSLVACPEGAEGKAQMYMATRAALHEGRLTFPNHPRLISQLRAVVSKPLPGGGVSISSPRSVAGGHGDLVSALCAAVWKTANGFQACASDFSPLDHY